VSSPSADELVVSAFNDAINAGDLAALTALMTADHRFIDTEGHMVHGRAACRRAWEGFFAAFPDYRNVFLRLSTDATGRVVADGYSQCSHPDLDGPARWRAKLRDGQVAEWRVEEPPT
jgi:ketosteroid isomerase-like protein